MAHMNTLCTCTSNIPVDDRREILIVGASGMGDGDNSKDELELEYKL